MCREGYIIYMHYIAMYMNVIRQMLVSSSSPDGIAAIWQLLPPWKVSPLEYSNNIP